MSGGRENWVRTTGGWLLRATAQGAIKAPVEGHHGPNAHTFSRTGETIEGFALAAAFAVGLVTLGAKALENNASNPTWTVFLLPAAAFLAAGAMGVWALFRMQETRGPLVIDPVERYVELPAGLLAEAHRAALGVTSASGRARIAFADITQIHRRSYYWRHREVPYLYIADRHGEVDLFIAEAQVHAAAELVTGWRGTG